MVDNRERRLTKVAVTLRMNGNETIEKKPENIVIDRFNFR